MSGSTGEVQASEKLLVGLGGLGGLGGLLFLLWCTHKEESEVSASEKLS